MCGIFRLCTLKQLNNIKINEMKTIRKTRIVILTMLMSLGISACSSSGSDDDKGGGGGTSEIEATYEKIVGDWYVTDIEVITGDHANWQGGKNLYFRENGTCKTCKKTENRYKINNGKIETYYSETFEPMFVYTLLYWEKDKIILRRDGTLDDTSSCKITAEREAEPELNPQYGNIDGIWYLKSEKWCGWDNGTPDNKITKDETYDDYAKELIWTIKKTGKKLSLLANRNGQLHDYGFTEWEENEFSDDADKFIIKSFYTTIMTIEYIKNFYIQDESDVEYGELTFIREP